MAELEPGDVVASLQPHRIGEDQRALVGLARRIESGQLPGVVVTRDTDPTCGDTTLTVRVGRASVSRGYRANVKLPIVSTSETDSTNLANLADTETSPRNTTGQEA